VSYNTWEDAEDNDSPLVKRLRQEIKDRDKALSERDATLAERDAELSTLRPQARLATVREILTGLSVKAKVAKLIPADVEPTKESVTAWLREYGDVLGITQDEDEQAPSETQDEPEKPAYGTPPEVTPDTAAQWARIQSQESSAGATTPDKEASDLAQLTAAYNAAKEKGGADAFFAMLQGEQAIP
jgi:hypothetical protein